MSTSVTWFDGNTYSIPAGGEINWPSLSNFLIALGQKASITTTVKQSIRKATTTPVSVSDSSDCVVVTQLAVAGAVTVNLPAGSAGRVYYIVDGTGDAGTNNVTINRNGSDTIAGGTSLVLNHNGQGVILVYNSGDTDWKVVAKTLPPGTVVNADVSSSAAIAYSKLALTNSVLNADINSSAAISYSKLSLTGSVVNADISNSAAIAYSKLALTNSILNADINSAAAIAYSKLALTGTIVNADISASAAIAYSKLALTGTIVNADVSASAAIAYSKLTLTGTIVNADISASAAIAYSKLALTGTVVNADISASAAIAYSKLNLGTSIVNADVAVAAAIARSKLASGTASHVLINDGSGVMSSEATLALTRGGTGQATATASFDALSPMTTKGDIITRSTTGNVRVAVGSDGQVLSADSAQTSGLKWVSPLTNPMSNPGEIIVGGTAGAATALAANTTATKKLLTETSSTAAWNQIDATGYFTTGATVTSSAPGIMPSLPASLDNTTATAWGFKTYNHGTTYSGGIAPTVTLSAGGGSLSSVNVASFRPYIDTDSNWWMTFTVVVTLSSATRTNATLSINGVTFLLVSGDQAIAAWARAASSGVVGGLADSNSSLIECDHASATTTIYQFAGNVRLASKPTWAF